MGTWASKQPQVARVLEEHLSMSHFPQILWGPSAQPLPWFVPLGRQSACWVSPELRTLRCLSTSTLFPLSPLPSSPLCTHVDANRLPGTECALRTSVLASVWERALSPLWGCVLGLHHLPTWGGASSWGLGGTRSLPCVQILSCERLGN